MKTNNDIKTLGFPKGFLWGTATAAFQIEGHPEEYSKKLSDWSVWIDREDKVLKPTNNGNAVKHFEYMEDDIDLIKNLNSNSYRFSLNWATIHRGENSFDLNTLNFYKSLLANLKSHSIKPFVTLVHFVLPLWLSKEGGWENPKTAYEFENFTKFILKHLGSEIDNWVTFNEPNIFLCFGYENGIWPPGYQNEWGRYLKAYQGMVLGHQLAYKAIKEFNNNAQIGFAQNQYAFQSVSEVKSQLFNETPSLAWKNSDVVPKTLINQIHNFMFIESCAGMNCLDFLGINYYTRFSYEFDINAKSFADPQLDCYIWGQLKNLKQEYPDKIQANSLNWEIYPEGLYQRLTDPRLKAIIGDIPIYITENGYCKIENDGSDIAIDAEDHYRIDFIREHLQSVHKAIQNGVNVQGYFYWSLLDNFEWALGMNPRFGLIHIDHNNFKRTPKASYHYYADISKNNCVNL